jgi:predicted acyltransferase
VSGRITRVTVRERLDALDVFHQTFFDASIGPCCGADAASLGYALTYVIVWAVVLGEMHRRRIFIAI